jgi:CIC family chloride channel protein
MTARRRTPFNAGRLLEATRADAPLLAWSVLVGFLAGGVGGFFRLGISRCQEFVSALRTLAGSGGAPPLLIAIASGALLVGLALVLVRRMAPEAAGSGIQEIEGALDGVRPLRWARVLAIKFSAGVLSLGSGMVMGREGPTVQMGGALGEMLRERFGLSEDHGRVLVAAGAGAGLTAAFNAPLAGILFVIEEMRPHFRYNVLSVQCLVIACSIADIVVRALLGDAVAFPLGNFPMPPLSGLISVALLGVAIGLVGWSFNASILWTQKQWARLGSPGTLAAGVAVGALVGALTHLAPDFSGGGYGSIRDVMSGRIPEAGLLTLFAGRFVLTVLCFSSGVPGGIFAPLVALGTIFGIWFAEFVPGGVAVGVDPGVFMIAGAGALFAATVRAPLTGIVLAVELTGNFQLILPVAIACVGSTLVAHSLGGRPIYTVLLERELESQHSVPIQARQGL